MATDYTEAGYRCALCDTCKNSVEIKAKARQVVWDWSLFDQGRLNKSFIRRSVGLLKELVDGGKG